MLPEDSAPTPFFQTLLAGPLLRAQRGLAVARAVLATVMAGAYFLAWHRVHKTNAGDRLGCIFSPDCHPGPPQPIQDTGESFLCTGYLHYKESPLLPLLAVVLVVVALAGLGRVRLWGTLLLEVAGLAVCAGILLALFELFVHMFERVEPLWGGRLFDACFLLLTLSWVVGPAVQCLFAQRSRRAKGGLLT